jgi:hypothetical protein
VADEDRLSNNKMCGFTNVLVLSSCNQTKTGVDKLLDQGERMTGLRKNMQCQKHGYRVTHSNKQILSRDGVIIGEFWIDD